MCSLIQVDKLDNLKGLSVDIESFWTEGYAGQIPNRGHWLAILL